MLPPIKLYHVYALDSHTYGIDPPFKATYGVINEMVQKMIYLWITNKISGQAKEISSYGPSL